MILTLQLIDGLLIVACILLAVMVGRLHRKVLDNEQLLQAVESLADGTSSSVEAFGVGLIGLKDVVGKHDEEHRHDMKLLSKEIAAVGAEVDELKEKASDAYEVVETQAKKEKRLFDGINAIMDYDLETARKAVSGDAE